MSERVLRHLLGLRGSLRLGLWYASGMLKRITHPGVERFFVRDPAGNRLEFQQSWRERLKRR